MKLGSNIIFLHKLVVVKIFHDIKYFLFPDCSQSVTGTVNSNTRRRRQKHSMYVNQNLDLLLK